VAAGAVDAAARHGAGTLGTPGLFRQVVSLAPHERLDLGYSLSANRRGYYQLGPLVAHSGRPARLGHHFKPIRCERTTVVLSSSTPIVHCATWAFRHSRPLARCRAASRSLGSDTHPGVRGLPARDSCGGSTGRRAPAPGRSRSSATSRHALETAIFLNLDGGDYPIAQWSTRRSWASSWLPRWRRTWWRSASGGVDHQRRRSAAAGCRHGTHPAPAQGRDHLIHLLTCWPA